MGPCIRLCVYECVLRVQLLVFIARSKLVAVIFSQKKVFFRVFFFIILSHSVHTLQDLIHFVSFISCLNSFSVHDNDDDVAIVVVAVDEMTSKLKLLSIQND